MKKTTTTTTLLCDKCKRNEVEIYHDSGDCCISCWYDMTDPKISWSWSENENRLIASSTDINDYSNINWYYYSYHHLLLLLLIHSFIIAGLIVMDKSLLYIICKIFKLLTWRWFIVITFAAATVLIVADYVNIALNSKWI